MELLVAASNGRRASESEVVGAARLGIAVAIRGHRGGRPSGALSRSGKPRSNCRGGGVAARLRGRDYNPAGPGEAVLRRGLLCPLSDWQRLRSDFRTGNAAWAGTSGCHASRSSGVRQADSMMEFMMHCVACAYGADDVRPMVSHGEVMATGGSTPRRPETMMAPRRKNEVVDSQTHQ